MPLKTFETTEIPTIVAQKLTPEAFSSFGGVISSPHQLASVKSASANYGTAVKLFKVSPIVNNYTAAPSHQSSSANFNLFRCSPPDHLIKYEANGDKNVYTMKVLERHPFSTQTFLPMGISKDQIAYMVIVAKTGSDGLPDPSTLQAFLANGNQAVTYGVATWHAPMVALNETVDFAVLIHENGVPDEDCQETYFDPGVSIEFSLVQNSKL